jgi:hypothetical protein
MAPCSISCMISLVFIISMIYMNNATQKSQVIELYQAQLPSNLQTLYKKITDERLRIYYYGYALGFIISLVIIIANYQKEKASHRMTTFTTICTIVSVSFLTNYFYYMLSPKSAWMLEHINSPEQSKAWLHMYKAMQKYYHTGLALGIVAVGFLGFAFRC